MTTIAYHHKDKQIAIDSRSCQGGIIENDEYDKTVKNSFGTWFLCGAVCDISDFVKLSKNDIINKDLDLDVSGFRITDDAVYYVFIADGVFCEQIIKYNKALGSGGNFALTAMDFGKSASESVEYAMTRDVYTGGKIHIYNIG